jgi:hypothetical protein
MSATRCQPSIQAHFTKLVSPLGHAGPRQRLRRLPGVGSAPVSYPVGPSVTRSWL